MIKLTLIQGDCLKILPKLPSSSVDLILTDPPYGISQKGKIIDRTKIYNKSLKRTSGKKILNYDFGEWDHFNSVEEYLNFIEVTANLMYHIAKDNCSLFMFVPKNEVSFIEYLLEKVGWHVRNTLVWCKSNPVPQIFKVGFMSGTEFIVFATKHKGRKHKWKTKYGQQLNWFVSPIVQGKERTEHPTQKPLWLIKKFIKLTTDKDDIVLDPFLGSGTTMKACLELKRNCIGIEINPEYIEITKKRLNWGSSLGNVEFEFLKEDKNEL